MTTKMLNLLPNTTYCIELNNGACYYGSVIEKEVHNEWLHSYGVLSTDGKYGYLWDMGRHNRDATAIKDAVIIGGCSDG